MFIGCRCCIRRSKNFGTDVVFGAKWLFCMEPDLNLAPFTLQPKLNLARLLDGAEFELGARFPFVLMCVRR